MSGVDEFRLPDLGEGLTEAELVSWAVAVGWVSQPPSVWPRTARA